MHLGKGDLLVALGPEHAAIIGREGYTKDSVRRFLYQNARAPVARFAPGLLKGVLEFRAEVYPAVTPDTQLPIVEDPSHIQITVAGGAGSMSSFIPGFGDGWSVCVPIDAGQ
jgi:hypothetical protein